MNRLLTLALGVALGAVAVVVSQRLRHQLEAESAEDLLGKLSAQVQDLEQRFGHLSPMPEA
jgi:hypothetical protein